MRRVFAVLVVITALVPGAAISEMLRLRTGDHPGFTRIVIPFSGKRDWLLTPANGGYIFQSGDPNDEYDLSQSFRLIGRERLQDLTIHPDTGALTMSLNCDCEVRTFNVRGNELVMDISDAEQTQPKRVSVTAANDVDAITAIVEGPIRHLAGTSDETTPRLPDPDTATVGVEKRPAVPLPALRPLPFVLPGTTRDRISRKLAEHIARAASQGLIDAPGASVPTGTSDETAPTNLNIETAIDRAFRHRFAEEFPNDITGTCATADLYDVASWGDERPPAAQIAELRRRLVGEFDRPDPEATRSLARLYVHLSFGTEALHTLESFPLEGEEQGVIRALAHLMGGEATNLRALTSQIGCDSPGALWAALALQSLPTDVVVNRDAILRSFNDLPRHLRRHLAARLAARFRDTGDDAAVSIIGNSVSRVAAPTEPEAALALAAEANPRASTDAGLLEIATSSRPEAADALLILLQRQTNAGGPVSPDLIANAEIFSFERAGTETAQRLKALEIRARLVNGDIQNAVTAFDTAIRDNLIPSGQSTDLAIATATALQTLDDNTAFLALAFDPMVAQILHAAPPDAVRPVAEKLLALGFADRSRELSPATAVAPGIGNPGYAAELALASGDTDRALSLTQDASDAGLIETRAEALARAGRYSEAAELLRNRGAEEESATALWLARSWAEIANNSTGARSAAARAMLDRDAALDHSEEPTLKASRDAIASSTALRETLGALLEDTAQPGASAQ